MKPPERGWVEDQPQQFQLTTTDAARTAATRKSKKKAGLASGLRSDEVKYAFT